MAPERINGDDPKPKENGSRFIAKLLKARDLRQTDRERRLERKIRKERDDEGDQYADKEVFVTNAYKEKLIEINELERQRAEEDKREAILDVKKQGNLHGFHRFLLRNHDRTNSRSTRPLEDDDKEDNASKIIKNPVEDSKTEENRNSADAESPNQPDADEKSVTDQDNESTPTDENHPAKGSVNNCQNSVPVVDIEKSLEEKAKLKKESTERMLSKKTIGVRFEHARHHYILREKQRSMFKSYIEAEDD